MVFGAQATEKAPTIGARRPMTASTIDRAPPAQTSVARPESACFAKLRCHMARRPPPPHTLARAAEHQAASQAYLRRSAAKKKLDDQAFAEQLHLEQQQMKDRLITKIEQANARTKYLDTDRVYSLVQDVYGQYAIGAQRSGDARFRVLDLDVFEREYRRLVTTSRLEATGSCGDLTVLRRHPPHSDHMRKSLVHIMNATTQLAEALDEQLLAMQRKGWNTSAMGHHES
ncbi:hypothetical protein SPRG_09759 [Saprolegnia parasitica CBS 223.65]|uniref:Uncharacterized protein n=1 Tax=Saprolegnia parasitica (strain CBS 223.65) TaxID=695850 RepID=A0A067C788_SAPPC|nr:hypothetical protein SPRG_09759 [Saprolegnia parasitica CBS 223.65]KDO25030.1 hypothetical protein SPRG_09759 [Saprolegnia parasitica CBS 223.65]|eukprot:XP_012204298.1 hypothetical protein SPRG_09759 [Saprolegnia parasitica CBS 223.65]